MNIFSLFRRHPLIMITILPLVLFIFLQVYWGILKTFYEYEIGTSWDMGQKQLERALAAKNPDYCSRIIVTSLMPGPARYDIVNGCYAGYATAIGDMSLCMGVIAPGLCVSAIAEKRNDPALCTQAVDPRRPETDRRGSCFGYFAKKEKDHKYCTFLESLGDIRAHQKIVCMMLYVDSTGDASHCSVHEQPDICYNKAARISSDPSICDNISNQEKRSNCKEETVADSR